jgi:hypothetical protein
MATFRLRSRTRSIIVHNRTARGSAEPAATGVHGWTGYCLSASEGPLTRFSFRWKLTSTWSAILMNGIPLFIP